MNKGCLFCRIRDGEAPSKRVYEDDLAIAFEDANPQAPMHVLVVPRKHIPTLNDVGPADRELLGHLFTVAAKIAAERGHAQVGWRALMNCNAGAGQSVFHVHLHVLGGRPMRWPPG